MIERCTVPPKTKPFTTGAYTFGGNSMSDNGIHNNACLNMSWTVGESE